MRRALLPRLRKQWRIARADAVTTVEVRQRLPIVAFVLALLWQAIWPQALAQTAIITLGCLLLFSLLWASVMAARVTGRRRLRYTALQVGDELEESFTLENRSILPVLWAEFADQSTLPGHSIAGIGTVGGLTASESHVRTICKQRGVFTLGPWQLRIGDPFGIFEARQTYEQRIEIPVYPPLAELPRHLLPHREKMGDLHRSHQPLSAETLSATTTRPYLLGDPLRRIHWRTTARHNKLFVKVFEPETASTTWLIPDVDASAHLGEGAESSFETMVILLASLTHRLLNERLSVGLLADAIAPEAVPPQYGPAHLWTTLRALAKIQPIPSLPLEKTLTLARSLVSARDSIVVVTPSIDPAWPQALKLLIGSRHDSGVQVILLDPASFGGSETADTFSSLLAEQGIAATVLRQGDIRPISGAYGQIRRWEFKALGTGRVVVRRTPRQASSPETTFM